MVTVRKPMTEIEKQLFKEAVIKEYKLKHKEEIRKQFADKLMGRLKALIPFEIVIGIGAAAILVYIEGWMSLVHLLLFGIIWLTLISTFLPILLKRQ